MSQFSVPQFTEVEDKIIGPLTLKQFIIILIGGAIIFVLYRAIPGFFFLFPSIPMAGLTLIVAFYKYNERPVEDLALGAVGFFADPRVYIFSKQGGGAPVAQKKRAEAALKEQPAALTPEERESRLKNLTYILEQETKAEEEMIKEKLTHQKNF